MPGFPFRVPFQAQAQAQPPKQSEEGNPKRKPANGKSRTGDAWATVATNIASQKAGCAFQTAYVSEHSACAKSGAASVFSGSHLERVSSPLSRLCCSIVIIKSSRYKDVTGAMIATGSMRSIAADLQ